MGDNQRTSGLPSPIGPHGVWGAAQWADRAFNLSVGDILAGAIYERRPLPSGCYALPEQTRREGPVTVASESRTTEMTMVTHLFLTEGPQVYGATCSGSRCPESKCPEGRGRGGCRVYMALR